LGCIVLSGVVERIVLNLLRLSSEFSTGLVSLTPSLTIFSFILSGMAGVRLIVVTGSLNSWLVIFPHD
jgi:hypothetical protein